MNKHQPESGHDVEKLLTEIMPQADVHFQETLERRLLAAYRQKKEGDKVKANGHLVTYADFVPHLAVNKNHQRRWSISLAATLVMVLFVGALIAFVGGLPGPAHEIHYSALQQVTPSPAATPTPNVIGRVPVVVASMRLPQYFQLGASSLEIQYRRADLMPEDVLYEIEPLIGAVLLETAAENRPITRSMVAIPPNAEETQPVLVTNVAITSGTQITTHMLTVQFIRPDEVPENVFYDSPLRTELEINAIGQGGLQAMEDIPSGTILLTSQIARFGVVFTSDGVFRGTWTTDHRPVVMTTQAIQRGTAITEEMLSVVYWPSELVTDEIYGSIEAVAGQTTLTDLRPYSPILTEYFAPKPENEGGTEIEAGRVAIAVPIPDDHFFYGFQVGDTISITASFFYVDADEINIDLITPVPDLPEGLVVPNDAMGTSRLSVQEVIPDAKIVGLNAMAAPDDSPIQFMVLAVTPEQADILAWLIDAQVPLQYRIVAPDLDTQESSPNSVSQGDLPDESTSRGLSLDAVTELKPIIITTQAIPRGTIITEEMLTIGYSTNELAALVPFDNIEEYVGRMAITNLSAYSLILDDQVVGFGEGRTPPIGDEYITIPFYSATNEYPALGVPGDHVDIIATLLTVTNDDASVFCHGAFSPNGTPLPCSELDDPEHIQSVKQKVVEDAEVISVNLVLSQSGDFTTATLKMSPDDVELMNWLLDAEVPLVYIPR